MARGRRPVILDGFVSVLLDSGVVRMYADGNPKVRAWLGRAEEAGVEPVISYLTALDVDPAELRLRSVVDGFEAVRLTLDDCRRGRTFVPHADGPHRLADLANAVIALRLPGPVAVLTTDPRNLSRLLADQPRIAVVTI